MIMSAIIFLTLILIFWAYCGYIIMLFISYFFTSSKKKKIVRPIENFPKIAVLVPCYNEEALVAQKAENLKTMNYDESKIDVYFLHGLSNDKTSEKLSSYTEKHSNWHLVETETTGKINQINYGLRALSDDVDIIVNTDMDALLDEKTLVKIVEEFNADDRLAVVGINIFPQKTIAVEWNHWVDNNIIRILESELYSASIVVAPCYACKKSLLEKIPDNCIADDIYTAFRVNSEGYLTKCIYSISGLETRNPQSVSEYMKHKYRKGNAYIFELFRFLSRLLKMPPWFKVIYLTKFLQIIIMPWLLSFFAVLMILFGLKGGHFFLIMELSALFLIISLIITSTLMRKGARMFFGKSISKRGPIVLYFFLNNIILILIGLSVLFYPLSRPYRKSYDAWRRPRKKS